MAECLLQWHQEDYSLDSTPTKTLHFCFLVVHLCQNSSILNIVFLQTNCNLVCGPDYGPETRRSMSQMTEKETPIEMIEELLKYIETLNVPGAVLVFLPGWNLIYSVQKHLEMNPHFGNFLLF